MSPSRGLTTLTFTMSLLESENVSGFTEILVLTSVESILSLIWEWIAFAPYTFVETVKSGK